MTAVAYVAAFAAYRHRESFHPLISLADQLLHQSGQNLSRLPQHHLIEEGSIRRLFRTNVDCPVPC